MFLPEAHPNIAHLPWIATAICSVILLLTTFVAGQDRVRIDRIDRATDNDIKARDALKEDGETFGILTICLALNSAFTLSSAMISPGATAEYLLPIASFLVTLPAAWKLKARQGTERLARRQRALDRLTPPAIVMIGVPGLLCGLVPELRSFCLIFAFLPSLFFEGIRLLDFYFAPYPGSLDDKARNKREDPSEASI